MDIQDVDTEAILLRRLRRLGSSRSKLGMSRITLVIALLAVLAFLGSLMLTIETARIEKNKLVTSSITNPRAQLHAKTSVTPAATRTSSPKVTSTATPSPITPFPPYLWQEITVLQSQNRFLFNGNRHLPEIALTFDDGPNPYYTPQILAILRQFRIKATFFCVGQLVAAYPDLVREEHAAGNIVGDHSWSHPNLGLLSSASIQAQIKDTSDIIQQTIAVRPTFFRPPYGVFNSRVLTQANLLGLTTVIWNDEARDWLRPGVDIISSRILGLAGDGAIILLHDGGGDRSQTVAALPTIITSLQSQGYRFVTLQQMVNDLPKNPAANPAPVYFPTPTPIIYPTPTLTPAPTFTPVISPTPTETPTIRPLRNSGTKNNAKPPDHNVGEPANTELSKIRPRHS